MDLSLDGVHGDAPLGDVGHSSELALNFRALREELGRISASRATSLTEAHIEPLIAAVARGEIVLRGEDLDIIEFIPGGGERVLGKVDRAIAHLYFDEGGKFADHAGSGGVQLLHRVSIAVILTPNGELVGMHWVRAQREMREFGFLGGHVKSGTTYEEGVRAEIGEELSANDRGGASISPLNGSLELIIPAGESGLGAAREREAVALFLYRCTEEDYENIIAEKEHLDALRTQLGEGEFYANRKALERAAPGRGEVWQLHLLKKEDLLDDRLLAELNAAEVFRNIIAQPKFWEAIGKSH